jgi:catechol 2,3-dioxygenase-like lactoylglutathione lyase family enzyme
MLAFTKLVVDDLDAELRFYTTACGVRELQRVRADIAGEAIEEIICANDDGSTSIILLKWLGRSSAPLGEVILGLTTPHMKALFERMVTAGGRVRQAPAASEAAGGLVVGFVEDPEGHLLEVVEIPSAT